MDPVTKKELEDSRQRQLEHQVTVVLTRVRLNVCQILNFILLLAICFCFSLMSVIYLIYTFVVYAVAGV